MRKLIGMFVAGIALASAVPAWAAYDITALTSPEGDALQAWGITNSGLVTGVATSSGLLGQRGFYRTPQGAFAYVNNPNGINGTTFGKANAANQIAGGYIDANNFGNASVLSGNFSDLPIISPTANSEGRSINNAGTVVGDYYDDDGNGGTSPFRGFLYTSSTYTLFDAPGANPTGRGTQAHDINNAGTVVGFYDDFGANAVRGFVRDAGGAFSAFDLSLPGVTETRLYGINSAGDLAGAYTLADGAFRGFVRRGGVIETVQFAATGNTVITDINDSGAVSGFYDDGSGSLIYTGFTGAVVIPEAPTGLLIVVATAAILAVRRRKRGN